MSSISGLSSSTMSSIQGYGGLASGLDRDALIEGMTYATNSKIASVKQKQDLLEWEQEAIQNVTDKLHQFNLDYMSFASSNNLLGTSIFNNNTITATGDNSDLVSILSGSSNPSGVSIVGISKLAQNAQMTSKTTVSSRLLATSEPNLTHNLVEGRSLTIRYGDTNYTINLPSDEEGYSYDTAEEMVASINKELATVELPVGGTLADAVKVEMQGDKVAFVNTDKNGNGIEIKAGSFDLLENLGIIDEGETVKDLDITAEGLVGKNNLTLTEEVTLNDKLSESSLSFEYNGTKATITLDKYTEDTTMDEIVKDLNDKLADAYGNERILVAATAEGGFSFKTTIPTADSSVVEDNSSILTLTGGSFGVVGSNGVLGINTGSSNRVNTVKSLEDSGLNIDTINKAEDMILKNGDVELNLTEQGLDWDSSVEDIMKAINDSDLDIKVEYFSMSDKLSITSTQNGASGNISLSGSLQKVMFGDMADYNTIAGEDATLQVKYEGSDDVLTVVRDSNTVNLDGLNVTLKGTFDSTTEAITFDSTVETEAAVEAVKGMVEDYNEIISLINSSLSEIPDRDYAPLTDEQRADMTEDQIEIWEKEAKKGLLFSDSDIRGLSDALRFIIPSSMREQFEEMGITVSTDYSENGKLSFDEAKFTAALAEDPSAVIQAFTSESQINADGTKSEAGLMVKLQDTIEKYAGMTGSTKGILVERAGSSFAPTSVLDNSLKTMIDDYDDTIAALQDTLQTETDRYVAQFTALETLIAEMNSQSSYLSSMFAY